MAWLIAFHFLQYMSFSYMIDKIKIFYWIFTLTVLGLFTWGVVKAGDVKCEPFLSNYILLDIIISFLAFLDYLGESVMEEEKRKMIGYNILQRYHDDVQHAFQDHLLPEIKERFLDITQEQEV